MRTLRWVKRGNGSGAPAVVRSAPAPRSASRYHLPFGTSALRARLESSCGALMAPLEGQLWNVSDTGSCLTVPFGADVSLPDVAVLHLCDPVSRRRHELEVEPRWISSASHATFVGLLFRSGALPRDSFLRDSMKGSWTDGVPMAGAF